MANVDPLGFETVTGAGVSAAKSSKREQDLNEKAKHNVDYKQVRESLEPPKPNKSLQAQQNRLMNEVAKELERQSLVDQGILPPEAAPSGLGDKTERYKMISKINRYMALPKNANRQIPKITDRTTEESLKAIIYDLENGSIGGGEMAFAALVVGSKLLVNLCNTRANVVGANLTGLDQNVAMNKEAFMPVMEELAIKYSHMASSGPWANLAFTFGLVAFDTHKMNTDPEYRKQKAEQMAAMSKVDPEEIAKARAAAQQQAAAAKTK